MDCCLESLGLDRATIRRRIAAAAERLTIEKLLPRAPHELSGGEKHLVTLAAILGLYLTYVFQRGKKAPAPLISEYSRLADHGKAGKGRSRPNTS